MTYGIETAWLRGRLVPWAAAAAAATVLASCSTADDTEDRSGGEDGAEEGGGQDGGDVPAGYQEIEAGILSYAVPEDWVPAPEAEEGEDLQYRYELLDDDEYILALAGLVPVDEGDEDVEALSARDVALDIASQFTIGNVERERDTDQEIDVPGARDAARNDHVLEERQHDIIDENNITDIIVITESNEVAVFRLNTGDDTVDDTDREQIISSIRVN